MKALSTQLDQPTQMRYKAALLMRTKLRLNSLYMAYLLFLLFSPTLLVADDITICRQHLAALGVENVRFEPQQHLVNAVDAVLKKRLAKGPSKATTRQLFETDNVDDNGASDQAFIAALNKLEVEDTFGATSEVELRNATGLEARLARQNMHVRASDSPVVSFETRNKTYFFRAADAPEDNGHRKGRKTLAASKIADWMGTPFTSKSVWAEVNGRLGVVSEEAPGESPTKYWDVLIKTKRVDPRSVVDQIGAQFLVQNIEVKMEDTKIDPATGAVKGVDFDQAFVPSLISIDSPDLPDARNRLAGMRLPPFYTASFVAGLKSNNMYPGQLRKKLKDLLSNEEIEGLIFRREVILKDIELRSKELGREYVVRDDAKPWSLTDDEIALFSNPYRSSPQSGSAHKKRAPSIQPASFRGPDQSPDILNPWGIGESRTRRRIRDDD